jgi:hypothetical protein
LKQQNGLKLTETDDGAWELRKKRQNVKTYAVCDKLQAAKVSSERATKKAADKSLYNELHNI